MWKLLRRFSEIYVRSTTFRKENSSTKFNKNPTNRLVASTMLKMDRRTDVVFLIYFIKGARKLIIKLSLPSSDFRILQLFTYVWDYVGRGDQLTELNLLSLVITFCTRVQLKCDGTRWRTGEEVKANGVGSLYSSQYLGTWFIHHYYGWCVHLGCQ
jgi:hypothetical protein